MKNPSKFTFFVCGVALLIGLSGCQPQSGQRAETGICTPHTPCTSQDQSFTVTFETDQLEAESPLKITIVTDRDLATQKLWLSGADMYMGRIPVLAQRQDERSWIADVIVPACTQNRMLWNLGIQGDERANVEFEVAREP